MPARGQAPIMIPIIMKPNSILRASTLRRHILTALVVVGHAHASSDPTQDATDCVADQPCQAVLTDASAGEAASSQTLTRAERRALRKAEKKAQQQAANDRLDWYPLSELSPAQLAATPVFCDGAYIEPKMRLSGEAYSHYRPGQVEGSSLTGTERENSGSPQGTARDALLEADRLTFTQNNDTAIARGDIELRQHGTLLRGSAATINTTDNTGVIENAEFLSHRNHTRGNAEQIRRESDTITRMINANYSRCAPTDNGWMLSAGEIELNQANGLATARNAVLRIGDVPIFYTPWITYPADGRRRSGRETTTPHVEGEDRGLRPPALLEFARGSRARSVRG